MRVSIRTSHGERKKPTSKYVGVSWAKSRNAWVAIISDGGKRKNLGYFDNEESAARCWNREAHRLGRPINLLPLESASQ
jgi:hypothetical protein